MLNSSVKDNINIGTPMDTAYGVNTPGNMKDASPKVPEVVPLARGEAIKNKGNREAKARLMFPNGITNIDYIRYEARPYNEDFQNNRNDEAVILYLPMPAEVNEQLEAGWTSHDDWIKKNTAILGKTIQGTISNEFSPKGGQKPKAVVEAIIDKALGTFGGDGSIRKVTERRRGRILNPVSEQFFTGMTHRTWEFVHKLVPESSKEAERLDDMINRFKSASSATLARNQPMFLNYPLFWDVKFMRGIGEKWDLRTQTHDADTPNPYLPDLNTCAITQIATNYSGAGSWARHSDGSPVEIDLTISLTELVIPTAANFTGLAGSKGRNLGRKASVGKGLDKFQSQEALAQKLEG